MNLWLLLQFGLLLVHEFFENPSSSSEKQVIDTFPMPAKKLQGIFHQTLDSLLICWQITETHWNNIL